MPVLLVFLVFFLVFLTVQAAVGAGPMFAVDDAVRDGMVAASDGAAWPDGPMQALADLGGPVPGGVALVGAYALACRRTRPRSVRLQLAAVAAGAVAAVSLLVVVGKIVLARPGPNGAPIGPGDWGYFPSGHTATSAVCFGAAALILGTALSPAARRRLFAGTSLLCGLIGFALLWCDYHWLGDVLASWTLCALTLTAAARFLPGGRGRSVDGE